ncbi:MAG: MmcQ/YjbR family DNA-binding protein [Methylobacterium sp.]|uniref:MmcQ/YjbR family DNA-binding protein n=1 Tax=Methylobacterium sp. TaxID=409 RepID=UPI0025E3B59A|nr:MmcQ/YjbR family DNA-binding protein [Methylobacterium sp.]MBX9930449.1 MmcQ/YjbR family DNA-binding protein [Methylobacterium sp.]
MHVQEVRALALSLPEVSEGAHQGRPDFRLGGRIFATLWVEEERIVVRLSDADRTALDDVAPGMLEPVPGAWGRRGWTSVDLFDIDEEAMRGILLAAWRRLAPSLLDESN